MTAAPGTPLAHPCGGPSTRDTGCAGRDEDRVRIGVPACSGRGSGRIPEGGAISVAGWRAWGGALLAGGAVVFAALETPVGLPEGSVAADPAGLLLEGAVDEAAPEDLGAFLAIRRWGVFEPEVTEPPPPPAEPAGPSIEPTLANLGFVGLIVTGDERAVLLRTPEGGVARVAPGDVLPNGRVLVLASDDRLVLQGEGLPEEVLTLFPSVSTVPPTGEAPPPAPIGPVDPDVGIAVPAAPGGDHGRRAGSPAAAGGAAGSRASR